MLNRLTACAVVLSVAAPVAARQTPVTDGTALPRLEAPIRFDGRVDPDEWSGVPTIPMVQFWPTWGDPVAHPTEIRLAYDDDYVYLAAVCDDDEPPSMTTYRRDAWEDRDDQVAIAIDSFDDRENAMVFVLYATGARIDALLYDDARDGTDPNVDWNTYWDAEASRTATGWEGEMRIPLSSLRFETPRDGPVTMGFSVFRYRADGGYMYQYPGTRNDWGYWSFLKPSRAARRQLSGVSSTRPLFVSPYATAGVGQAWDLNGAETAYLRTDTFTREAGLDVKYSLTSNLTLDLTVNTDFAQVEADNQQVNLTRFSLFFPEKRQFFLERGSNFDFAFSGNDRLFYSRRIGLVEGREVPILGGGRVVGRIGDWDVGVLTLQTGRERLKETDEGETPLVESENFGVFRVKRRVLNQNSYLGAVATSRIGEEGSYNVAYGVDGVLAFQDDLLRFAWAQTFDDERDARLATLDNSRLRVFLERPRSTGLRYGLGVNRAGAEYRPGIGYQRRGDYTQGTGRIGYGRLTASGARIRTWSVEAESNAYYELDRREIGTLTSGLEGEIEFRSTASVRAELSIEHEDLVEGFSLSDDADIPSDTYTYAVAELGWTTPNGLAAGMDGEVRAGGFYDGTQFVVALSPGWSVSERVSLGVDYEYDRIRFADRDQSFDAHIARGRAELTLNTRLTLSSFVQYNSASDAIIANVRFRYNPRDGNDFYLVWNEGFNTDRHAADPMLPFTTSRTVLAKLVYTFRR